MNNISSCDISFAVTKRLSDFLSSFPNNDQRYGPLSNIEFEIQECQRENAWNIT